MTNHATAASTPPGISTSLAALDETTLLKGATLIKSARSLGDADVYRAQPQGFPPLLVKSYRRRPLFIRWLFARHALRNEYCKLAMIGELQLVRVPRPLALINKDTLVVEFLENATPLNVTKLSPKRPPREFFTRLRGIIGALHQRGISHGDFRSANIMVTHDGEPCLIDFATAVCNSPRCPLIDRVFFPIFKRTDLFAMAKIIAAFYPDMLNDKQKAHLSSPPWYLKFGRFCRKNIYRRYIKQSAES